SRGLHPSVLDDLGLAPAVIRHAEEFSQVYGIPVDVRIEGSEAETLPPLLQTTIYRVLQEALTNVAKHAGARRVGVRLARGSATVELRVRDQGAAFEPTAPAEVTGRHGLGLQGMRERAALLGGSVDVAAQPGAG